MQVEDHLWFYGAYYIDYDELEQLRIVGPGNHLLFGSVSLKHDDFKIEHISLMETSQVRLLVRLSQSITFFHDPSMGHIRKVRDYIQVTNQAVKSFAEVNGEHPGVLAPNYLVSMKNDQNRYEITYLRTYGERFYGTKVTFPSGVDIKRDDSKRGFEITSSESILLEIETTSSELAPADPGKLLNHDDLPFKTSKLEPNTVKSLDRLYDRTSRELNYLIRSRKTSGFDYGTVFPRDWMETADLIATDLTPRGLVFMYDQALSHVNVDGAGWHEDIIGELMYEREEEMAHLSHGLDAFVSHDHPLSTHFKQILDELDELFVSRLMIDIEPHYILGLQHIPIDEFDGRALIQLRLVAKFIIERASQTELIMFNRVAPAFRRTRDDEYYVVGNWRDSGQAFKGVAPIIAPFDVNAVFYPQALKLILENAKKLEVKASVVRPLVEKWSHVKERFLITSHNGTPAYALALYGDLGAHKMSDFKPLKIDHLDEAYDLFYGEPTQSEVISFCRRLIDPAYFYTRSGPILVGRDEGYNSSQYHGEVIWTKQTAFAVAGIERQLVRARTENWEPEIIELLRTSLLTTAKTSLDAFVSLGAIPELHYDDNGRPRFYSDQAAPEGQMNQVQLWSAAGARRIMSSYLEELNRPGIE